MSKTTSNSEERPLSSRNGRGYPAMKIGFVVNEIETEQETYTTTRLAMTAVNRGHEVWHIGISDFAFDPDDHIRARARSAPKEKYKTQKAFLAELLGKDARTER